MLKTYSKEMQRTMRSYKEEYQYWLDSPALSEEECARIDATLRAALAAHEIAPPLTEAAT